MKDIHGYATQSDLDGVPIILVYSNVKQAELLAEITGGGKAVPVLVTDNSRLARLRIAREVFAEWTYVDARQHPGPWIREQIDKEKDRLKQEEGK